jgi:hypothetical protein
VEVPLRPTVASATVRAATAAPPPPAAPGAPPAPAAGHEAPASEPPARARLDEELLERVQLRDRGNGRYDVRPSDFNAVLDNAGPQGFTVYDAKLASRAGIQIGDRILNVNGQVVNGLGSLYRIYQELRENPSVASVEVLLERAGQRLRKIYQVR